MNRVTICPNFFVLDEDLTPENIQKSYILPLSDFLDRLNEKNVELFIESNILEILKTRFPWSLYNDNSWKGYIKDWQIILFSKVGKKCKNLIDSSNNQVVNNYNCSHNIDEINFLFSKFLLDFKSQRLSNGNYTQGIYIHETCNEKETFFNFKNIIDLVKVEYSWLQIYDERLPFEGQFPFIPPANWESSHIIIRGNQHGFIDSRGNEWCWDRLHQDHWDVQHQNGTHTNVNSLGKIL